MSFVFFRIHIERYSTFSFWTTERIQTSWISWKDRIRLFDERRICSCFRHGKEMYEPCSSISSTRVRSNWEVHFSKMIPRFWCKTLPALTFCACCYFEFLFRFSKCSKAFSVRVMSSCSYHSLDSCLFFNSFWKASFF